MTRHPILTDHPAYIQHRTKVDQLEAAREAWRTKVRQEGHEYDENKASRLVATVREARILRERKRKNVAPGHGVLNQRNPGLRAVYGYWRRTTENRILRGKPAGPLGPLSGSDRRNGGIAENLSSMKKTIGER